MGLALEIAANAVNALSILLAGLNSVHTWWTGIAGCILFGFLFYLSKLYADVTLQLFFVATSVAGWWSWRQAPACGVERPVRRTGPSAIGAMALAGIAVAAGYGWLLHRFTDAYAPFWDSIVLAFSVLGQFLLVARRIETWWCWIIVNTTAVPLYYSRDLKVTAALYAAFWVNAVISLWRWRKLVSAS